LAFYSMNFVELGPTLLVPLGLLAWHRQAIIPA